MVFLAVSIQPMADGGDESPLFALHVDEWTPCSLRLGSAP